MNRSEKQTLLRIILTATIFAIALPLHYMKLTSGSVDLLIFLVPYLLIGHDILWRALRNIARGQVFDENFLMSVATVGAFILGEYPEGVAVMLFYQIGELFQSYAVSKSRRNIAELMDIRPDYANIMRDGVLTQVNPDEIQVDDIITVKPGERIPLDGVVAEGFSSVDTSALTGEAAPRDVLPGENVISGCINQTGLLTVKVTKIFSESTVSKILELVENSAMKKSKSEKFITRFARYYTPAVVYAAVALAVLPPLLTGQDFSIWVNRALIFLVISCPCALVISVPLSFFGGIGGASKIGVLVKGTVHLEMLADTQIAVFDKTGTLTKGAFLVTSANPQGTDKDTLLELAAYAEDYSNHPIAESIKKTYGKIIDKRIITKVEELPGYGVKAMVNGNEILAGNAKLMAKEGIPYDTTTAGHTVVHVAQNHHYRGYINIEDEIKGDAKQAVADLKNAGIKDIVMLTGDNAATGRKVAANVGIDRVYTDLLPVNKVDIVEGLMESKNAGGRLVFVGDGINDAPVLARADVGVAMGGLGSDAAIEAADVVIMTDEPSKLAKVIQISQKTLTIVRQNIVFALGVKIIVMALGAMGLANMWAAVFADVGVSVLAILNAMRALNVKAYIKPDKAESALAVKPEYA